MTGDRRGKPRGARWDYVDMAIDDHSRGAHTTTSPNETGASTGQALIAALHYYPRLGVWFKAVLADNRPALVALPRPIAGWACAIAHAAYLPSWLHEYNEHRPHASLHYKPLISRLQLNVDNGVGLHT